MCKGSKLIIFKAHKLLLLLLFLLVN